MRCTIPRPASRDNVPQIAAALLDAPARALAARPLHHQCGGAEFHRQCAAGGRRVPSMTLSAEEIGPFVAGANALLVNLGTFDRERREAAVIAVEAATRGNVPWVLDPVFVDRSAAARSLRPRADRAARRKRCGSTRAEFSALAGERADARSAGGLRARQEDRVGLSGETDLVSDGERLAAIANGHPLMAKVTAMGCAGSALVAACLAVEPDAWRATAAALSDRRRCRRIGGRKGRRPRQLRGRDRRCAVMISMGRRSSRAQR